MICPECGHRIPNNHERCLYCGSKIEIQASVAPAMHQPAEGPVACEAGKGRAIGKTAEEGKRYVSLDDLPEPLRKKVIEALEQIDGGDAGEGTGFTFIWPGSSEELAVEGNACPDSRSGYVFPEEYFDLQLSRLRGKRRAPVNRLFLTFIFFGAMALMGIAVWIMG